MTRVALTLKSANSKVGPIPVSTTSAATCPDACPLKGAGCYAEGGPVSMVWRGVTEGRAGMDWQAFVDMIRALPTGQLWRHNQAGDLPGAADAIDATALQALVEANVGKRGFTYTHKPVSGDDGIAPLNREAVAGANASGFTVNLSANTLAHADELAALAIGPVAVVLDATEGERADAVTPAGRKVVTCPATYRDNVTCASCKLCAVADRKVIVGFPAHGFRAKKARAVAAA